MSLKSMLVLGLALAAVSTPAIAGRTVIDQDPLDPDKSNQMYLGGYCDVDGSDCTPQPLGYSVDFGTGQLSDLIVYGNGMLSFGPNPVPLTDVSSLADYGGNVVSPGLDNSLTLDFADFSDKFELIGSISVDPKTGAIVGTFQNCFTPQFCNIPESTLTLTPSQNGYNVVAQSQHNSVSGYALADGTVDETSATSRSFFIAAKFSGLSFASSVPETQTWAMMLVGFGLTGGAMRSSSRRKRSRKLQASRKDVVLA